jgi:hypothetical protein
VTGVIMGAASPRLCIKCGRWSVALPALRTESLAPYTAHFPPAAARGPMAFGLRLVRHFFLSFFLSVALALMVVMAGWGELWEAEVWRPHGALGRCVCLGGGGAAAGSRWGCQGRTAHSCSVSQHTAGVNMCTRGAARQHLQQHQPYEAPATHTRQAGWLYCTALYICTTAAACGGA